jgi:hypothetical protein
MLSHKLGFVSNHCFESITPTRAVYEQRSPHKMVSLHLDIQIEIERQRRSYEFS